MDLFLQTIAVGGITLLMAILFSFIYYVIGEPFGVIGEPSKGGFTVGRPLSFFGRWVSDNYGKVEDKQNAKHNEKVGKKGEELSDRLKLEIEFIKDSIEDPNEQKKAIAEKMVAADKELEDYAIAHFKKRPLNGWSILGACPTCFKSWLSIIGWTVLVLVGIEINIVLAIVAAPASAYLSNKVLKF